MIPESRLSITPQPAPFLPGAARDGLLVDTEMGGVALNDPSQGLNVKLWTARYEPETGNLYLSAPDVTEVVGFTRAGITEISLTFDQNMNPFVAFVQDGRAKFWWFDTVAGEQTFAESLLSASVITPRCTLDDKRQLTTSSSDIILAYVRESALYYRQQRDRYESEYLLGTLEPYTRLIRVGMNSGNRLQWELEVAQP